MGRLAPEDDVIEMGLGERGERIDPCAQGMRFLVREGNEINFLFMAEFFCWQKVSKGNWKKTGKIIFEGKIGPIGSTGEYVYFAEELKGVLTKATGVDSLRAECRVIVERKEPQAWEVTTLLVNTSSKATSEDIDTCLYQCKIAVEVSERLNYQLENLPDSFRYDRSLPAYGINCGVEKDGLNKIKTTDLVIANKQRPKFWNEPSDPPDLSFSTLSKNTMPSLEALHAKLVEWGGKAWSEEALQKRMDEERWTEDMYQEALKSSVSFWEECQRIENGLSLLRENKELLKSFQLMNAAMVYSSRGKYDSWRPFQIGFLLANLLSIVDKLEEPKTVDIVWFATGGGKTETYLGLIVTASFYDRIKGKSGGISAWSRFPLRMLSLQQNQRFANALAAAELVRRENKIHGDDFSVGFFVGRDSTPNSISPDAREGDPDPDDEEMPKKYQVLTECPFCFSKSIKMKFDRRSWRLAHCCENPDCPWEEEYLPYYIVDDEIYRFLPTVIVGTLDKAASLSWQAAMRGLVGPPLGKCSIEGHGYVYSPRYNKPNGCLVPGCPGEARDLDLPPDQYAPSFRLQDEMHLLKDSLGAVDSHYESIFDGIQFALSGRKSKILTSSATLSGYEKQVEVLYRRYPRVFPTPNPSQELGFWTLHSDDLMRSYIAVAPRGVTMEFAVDRILTTLQRVIRDLLSDPDAMAATIGIEKDYVESLISSYGTNVAYGNTLKDLDATARSLETQVNVDGVINTANLTGRTDFSDVRNTLRRLENPEEDFDQRIHVVTASSMMSHGVDIDRLNIMVMMGIPLNTSEFIQATARVGRRWPGLVFVTHRMGRERDANVFRSFDKYIEHGDRFIEPIPITRRSKRVLQKTMAGLELAKILMVYEPKSDVALTTVKELRKFFSREGLTREHESSSAAEILGAQGSLDERICEYIQYWLEIFLSNMDNPQIRFTADLSPTGSPMMSLRDVEEQAPIVGEFE